MASQPYLTAVQCRLGGEIVSQSGHEIQGSQDLPSCGHDKKRHHSERNAYVAKNRVRHDTVMVGGVPFVESKKVEHLLTL